MEGRQRRKQWRAIFDSVSHQLGTQTSESWEHSHTFKWSLLFMLECNHFKCSFSATDLRSIWFKNALARDFFSWAHNFKAFPPIPLWPQPCKSRREVEPADWQFLWNPVSRQAAVPTILPCLLCSSVWENSILLDVSALWVCWPYVWEHATVWNKEKEEPHLDRLLAG